VIKNKEADIMVLHFEGDSNIMIESRDVMADGNLDLEMNEYFLDCMVVEADFELNDEYFDDPASTQEFILI
jgi:hypothetical protein